MKNKIYKLFSIVLSVMIVFSCCSVAMTAFAGETTTHEYYINAETGSDEDGVGLGTSEAPFLTLKKVITQATTDGFNVAGKTVIVYVTNASNSTSDMWMGGVNATFAFDCDLKVIGTAPNTYFYPSQYFYMDGAGSITLKNLYIKVGQWGAFCFGNKDVYIEKSCTIVGNSTPIITAHRLTGNATTDVQNLIFKSTVPDFHIAAQSVDGTFNNRFNLVYDVAGGTQTYKFGCPRATKEGTFTTKYNDAINLNIKNGNTITFAKTAQPLSFTLDAPIQIINSAGATLSGLDTITETVTDGETTSEVAVDKWILNFAVAGFKNALDFTDAVGKYSVKAGYSVSAAKAAAPTVAVASVTATTEDALLDLTQYGVGEYIITVEKQPETTTFFVSATGSDDNDGKTVDTPLATINKALLLADAEGDYIKGDTVYVKTVGEGDIATGLSEGVAFPSHSYKLVITANDTAVKANIASSEYVILGGETEFDYVNIKGYFFFNGNSATFGDNADFFGKGVPFVGSSATLATTAPINITASKLTAYGIRFVGNKWNTTTYNHPLTIEIKDYAALNNDEINGGFVFSYNEGSAVYNAPVNLKVDQSNIRLVFKSTGTAKYGANFALQLINSTGKAIAQTGDSLTNGSNQTPVTHTNALDDINNKWIINNNTGDADAVSFTDNVGEYVVDVDNTKVALKVTDVDGEDVTEDVVTTLGTGYYVAIPDAGTYTFTLECIEHDYDHACDTDCNVCGEIRLTEHAYDNDCDANCNECGETRTPADHVYDNDCDADCNECGATRTPADHIYDNDCDVDCNECGATRTPADHVYDNDCDADCNECGATRTPADHVYDNDCDADCNECGATRIPADHVYDDACDADCNECGATRTTAHIYDNDCDADCNECGETRTPADHVYDNDCDVDCNECGEVRVTEHAYDNNCDSDCNECGATRTPEDHIYDNGSDTDCNECGAIRQLGAQLIEEGGVKYYYYDGVKLTTTGIVDFEGKKMYINKGRFLGATGLVTVDGKKMYINKGYFLGKSGLVTINGKKTYVNKGYFTGASGLVTISGKKMYINKGYFTGASGLVTISGKKMYINKGYFTGASGLVTISGKKVYINKGYFLGKTGIVKISGKRYYIKKGYAQLSFSGKVKISGKTYTIKKGIVK